MADLVPSYVLKAERAEKHLGDLKFEITRWANTHPYELRPSLKGKPDSYNLHFTQAPPRDVGMIAADFVYNIQSGLDHLMGALVPSAERSSVYFPIYFEGVWEDPVPGEDEERAKARRRWSSNTAKVRPEAVAILKSLQPKESARQMSTLLAISRISNRDKHEKLPVLFTGLRGMRVLGKDANGILRIAPVDTGNPVADQVVYQDGAEINLPGGPTVDVEVTGSPVIAVQIGNPERNVEIPNVFDLALGRFRDRAIGPLAPYVHRPGGRV